MIYLLRHGQTELNKQNLMQGQCDHPLNEQGRLQARNAGKVIRDSGLKFDRVFSSPLRRAVETGEIALCVSGRSSSWMIASWKCPMVPTRRRT